MEQQNQQDDQKQQVEVNSLNKMSRIEELENRRDRILLIFTFVVLIIIIGVLSFFLFQEKSNNDKITYVAQETEQIGSDQTSNNKDQSQVFEVIPEGFEVYDENEITFLYPEDWGSPKVEIKSADMFIGERYFGQPVKYSNESSAWEYVPTEGWEGEGIANDVAIIRKSKDITIWSFGFGDAGCGSSVPTYYIDGKIVSIYLPTSCSVVDDQGNFSEDLLEVSISDDKKINTSVDEFNENLDVIYDSIVKANQN